MVAGAAVAFGWEIAGLTATTEIAPMVAGVLASTSTMLVVSLATQSGSPVPQHIRMAMDDADNIGPIPSRYVRATDPTLAPAAQESADALEPRHD
jgi:sodium/proline symporter